MKKLFVLLLMLAACNPLRHYEKVATDPNVTTEKKAVIAPWVLVHFPNEVQYIKGKDSIITKVDSSANLDLVDSLLNILATKTDINVDSLKQAIKDALKPVVITHTIYHTDTAVKHLDEAERFILQDQINKKDAQHTVDVTNLKDKDQKIADFGRKRMWLIIAIIGEGLGILALLYLLFKPSLKL